MKFCPKCGAYSEDIEESCKRCGALLAASGRVDSTPRLNRTLVRILAFLCMACGLVGAYFGFYIGFFAAGLAAMMRDPSLGVLIILFPVAAGLPFFFVSFFLFRFRPWARRVFVVLLTLALVPLAAVLGGELGLERTAPLDVGAPFTFLAAVLVLTVSPATRKAFGQRAGLWWLEALLAVLPVLMVFSARMREAASIREEIYGGGQQQERNTAELIKLLQAPESQETDARIGELISAGAYVYAEGTGEMSPLVLAAKNPKSSIRGR